MLHCFAVCVCLTQHIYRRERMQTMCCSALQRVAVCCSVLQCVAVCCSVLQSVANCCCVLQMPQLVGKPVLQVCYENQWLTWERGKCCSVLQCVSACCSALLCVATHCNTLQHTLQHTAANHVTLQRTATQGKPGLYTRGVNC